MITSTQLKQMERAAMVRRIERQYAKRDELNGQIRAAAVALDRLWELSGKKLSALADFEESNQCYNTVRAFLRSLERGER